MYLKMLQSKNVFFVFAFFKIYKDFIEKYKNISLEIRKKLSRSFHDLRETFFEMINFISDHKSRTQFSIARKL